MTTEELIKNLEVMAAMIEWDYPIDFQIYLEEAIKRLKEDKK